MPVETTLRLMMIVAGARLAGVAPTRGQSPDCPAWEQKHPADTPSPRWGHGMAYDSTRGTTVLFGGGRGNPPFLNDTWELPSCPVDSDGDGIIDPDDECDDSDLGLTVVIDGCDSGVANHLFDDGCTIGDRDAACAEGARNHGAFVRCVEELTISWVRDKIITSRDQGPIQRCAARANLPEQGEVSARPSKGASTSPVEALSRP